MQAPSVVIGLGTTGKRTVEFLQMMLYARFNGQLDQLRNFIKLVVIDTVAETKVEWFPTPNNIIQYIPISTYNTLNLSQIRNGLQTPAWWDEAATQGVNVIDSGAYQCRCNGRGALWFNMGNGTIMADLQGIFNSLNAVILNPGPHQATLNNLGLALDAKISTYIVGSFTGGTCSSIFVDVAHYVNSITHVPPHSFFYLPSNQRPSWVHGVDDFEGAKQCAWAALGDLMYIQNGPIDQNGDTPIYPMAWANTSPFCGRIVLLSPFSGGNVFPTRDSLEKLGAFSIYVDIHNDFNQNNIGAVLPWIFTLSFSGNYAPIFEVNAAASIKRLSECIILMTGAHNQGNKPHELAIDHMKGSPDNQGLLKEMLDALKANIDFSMPKDSGIGAKATSIAEGLANNMNAAKTSAEAFLRDKVREVFFGPGKGNFNFLLDYLKHIRDKLTGLVGSYSMGVTLEQIKGLDWRYLLAAKDIKTDRWDNFAEGLVLKAVSDNVLPSVISRLNEYMRVITDNDGGIISSLNRQRDEQLSKIQEIVQIPMNAAGVLTTYINGTVENDVTSALQQFGLIPNDANCVVHDRGLQLNGAPSNDIDMMLHTPLNMVSGRTKDFVIKSLREMITRMNAASGYRQAYQNNVNMQVPASQFNPYLQLSAQVLGQAGRQLGGANNIINQIGQGMSFYVYCRIFGLQTAQQMQLSRMLAFSDVVKPNTIPRAEILKRRSSMHWQKVLDDVRELAIYLMFEFGFYNNEWRPDNIRQTANNFSFAGGACVAHIDGARVPFDQLDNLQTFKLAEALRQDMNGLGQPAATVLLTLQNKGIITQDKQEKLQDVKSRVTGGIILW